MTKESIEQMIRRHQREIANLVMRQEAEQEALDKRHAAAYNEMVELHRSEYKAAKVKE